MRSPHKLSFPLYAYIFIQYAPIVFVLIIRIFLDFTTFQKHNCVKGQHDYNFQTKEGIYYVHFYRY
nr:MAG TPA: hypothetical protein [Caudoviricetes sp.]